MTLPISSLKLEKQKAPVSDQGILLEIPEGLLVDFQKHVLHS